jgi:glycine dehydrogenase
MPTQTIQSNVENDLELESFIDRHVGSDSKQIAEMLKTIGFDSLDALIDATVPESIRLRKELNLPIPQSEYSVLQHVQNLASQNKVMENFIGMGYHESIMPTVILRNILENPGWYTAYTPYQAEIAQGRLEALLNFQTMIIDLTGMEISNASLLDEATSAAEAVTMFYHLKEENSRNKVFISQNCHPQNIDVIQTRALPLQIDTVVGDYESFVPTNEFFAIVLQYPGTYGEIPDYTSIIKKCKSQNVKVILVCDLMSLLLLKSPGELGADVAVGSSQRFGLPLGYGGPHAGFFATKDEYKRSMPGRLVGVSKDRHGNNGLRLSLQTREQHIRRDKATSNICTAQVLLAVLSSMYAVYHGPIRLKKIATRIHSLTEILKNGIEKIGHRVVNNTYFDTLLVELKGISAEEIIRRAESHGINFRKVDSQKIGISLGETTNQNSLLKILNVLNPSNGNSAKLELQVHQNAIPESFQRKSEYLTHPIFNSYHTETEMLRYIHKLEAKDIALNTSMISLGSCTMKLNATTEMIPVTWKEFNSIHPFAPKEQAKGYSQIFQDLEKWLSEITGFDTVSLQPNAGSQGEYAGLLCVRGYHISKGESNRNICLIPVSAHGTNPASAVMAGYKVVPVNCDSLGNIDIPDLRAKAEKYGKDVGVLMVTYPSTHGVFETAIKEICEIVHNVGGNVYMDGANMNAQVGLCRPGDIGADVCHLNLHKTFCIPHGGGGPGIGPIGVKSHLAPFLPGHNVIDNGTGNSKGSTTSAPYGSASILLISYIYILMLGSKGLTHATKMAILNANYIAKRLDSFFPVLYKGEKGMVAHECILDFRKFKTTAGVEVEDVAKRLIDYGFHAPTMSWPVPGTLMVEPTESESKAELDRFCDAMVSIHKEIVSIESGTLDKINNPLKNAPHTAKFLCSGEEIGYSRELAAFPLPYLKDSKYWPPVGRVDNVYGDRNLVCSCLPIENYS